MMPFAQGISIKLTCPRSAGLGCPFLTSARLYHVYKIQSSTYWRFCPSIKYTNKSTGQQMPAGQARHIKQGCCTAPPTKLCSSLVLMRSDIAQVHMMQVFPCHFPQFLQGFHRRSRLPQPVAREIAGQVQGNLRGKG